MHAYTRGSQSLVYNDAHLLCKCRQVPDIIQYQAFEWEGSQKNDLSPTYLIKIAVHVSSSIPFAFGRKQAAVLCACTEPSFCLHYATV